ncbi:hypothetical protein V8B97DRAFT_415480 [Scleroderma yunnanense]
MTSPKSQCSKCGKEFSIQNLMRCARCKSALYCSNACQKSDWHSHKSTCKPPAPKKGPSQSQQPTEPVIGIRIACNADRDEGAQIFTPTSQVGLPIIVYRHHQDNPLTMIGDAGLDNQIATYLMIEPSTGFASAGWTKGGVVGSYATFILDLYGEGFGTPARQLTPAGFRRFCTEYKEEKLLNGKARFNNMPIPL